MDLLYEVFIFILIIFIISIIIYYSIEYNNFKYNNNIDNDKLNKKIDDTLGKYNNSITNNNNDISKLNKDYDKLSNDYDIETSNIYKNSNTINNKLNNINKDLYDIKNFTKYTSNVLNTYNNRLDETNQRIYRDLKNNNVDISNFNNSIEGLKTSNVDILNKYYNIYNKLEYIKKDNNELLSYYNDINKQYKFLKIYVDNIENDLQTNISKYDNIYKTKVDNLNTNDITNKNKIIDISKSINNILNSNNKSGEDIIKLITDINGIKLYNTSTTDRIDAINNDIYELKNAVLNIQNIDKNTLNITENNALIKNLQNDYNSIRNDITTNNEKITQLEILIGQNTNSGITKQISDINNNILGIYNKLNLYKANNLELEKNIATLTNNINTLSTNNSRLTNDISDINKKITTIENINNNNNKIGENLLTLKNNINRFFNYKDGNTNINDKLFQRNYNITNPNTELINKTNILSGMRINTSGELVNENNVKICEGNTNNCMNINISGDKFNFTPENNVRGFYINGRNNILAKFDIENNNIYLGGENDNAPLHIKGDKTTIKNLNITGDIRKGNDIISNRKECPTVPQITVPNIFINLFNRIKPHAYYSASYWDGNTLPNVMGNGFNSSNKKGNVIKRKSDIGNGNSNSFDIIKGGKNDGILFPDGSIPSTYTFCALARYSGNNRGRIFDGTSGNWLHGWWNGVVGIMHYGAWKTPTEYHSPGHTDWAVICGTNANPSAYYYNGYSVGLGVGGNVPKSFGINMGEYNNSSEASDFEIADIIIFNKGLTHDDMKEVSNILLNKINKTPKFEQPIAKRNWAGNLITDNERCGPEHGHTVSTWGCCSRFGWRGGNPGAKGDPWCDTYHGFGGQYDIIPPR